MLQVTDLTVSYYTDGGRVTALDGVNLAVGAGEKLGLVGESGAGKSTLALALMRMVKPPGRIEHGQVIVDSTDLTRLPDKAMRRARLSQIAYIPQGAMNALNPVTRIGAQMLDAIRAHDPRATRSDMEARSVQALQSVDLKPEVFGRYAHELSCGMQQRVCIAISLLLRPKVIICDEPTSALDVVTQRQVMETLGRAQAALDAAVILIGHDMGLMAQFVDRVAVMYAGRLVELSSVRDVFTHPKHPYTQALISSLPSLENRGVFRGLPGLAPSLLRLPSGCAFHPRCPHAQAICHSVRPSFDRLPGGRRVACHLYTEQD
jgi:oligopeptide/dipeptide ABC transporter ATP-binding protein